MATTKYGTQVQVHQIGSGRKVVTTAGTAVALSATALVVDYLRLMAETNNTGLIVQGAAGVIASLATREGIVIGADKPEIFEGVDLAAIFIDSTVNGDGVTFSYEY